MNLSPAMTRVLRQLGRGQPPWAHCRRQGDYGGLVGTLRALRKRGLIDHDSRLTDAGVTAAGEILRVAESQIERGGWG